MQPNGELDHRLYRKEQQKPLTLHYNSHHPARVKTNTVLNMYKTAEQVSSNDTNKEYSIKIIDDLLQNNGYNTRVLNNIKTKKKKRKKSEHRQNYIAPVATCKIPFLSDQFTAEIKRLAKQCYLPIRIMTTQPPNLRDQLTSSRPQDQPVCPNNNCVTCQCLVAGKCTAQNVIYKIVCEINNCKHEYIGETYRPLHLRFIEHHRSACNPLLQSYKYTPFGKHYTTHHPNVQPKLALHILDRAKSTKNRKIKEAMNIIQSKPEINDKKEQKELRQLLI